MSLQVLIFDEAAAKFQQSNESVNLLDIGVNKNVVIDFWHTKVLYPLLVQI